jgi:hypothetical protein
MATCVNALSRHTAIDQCGMGYYTNVIANSWTFLALRPSAQASTLANEVTVTYSARQALQVSRTAASKYIELLGQASPR